jgi:hypothetical protein
MGNLSKLTCSILMIAGLSGAAFGAEADTETPAAPAATGADNQPDKPPTAVMSHSATVIKNGSKEEEKGAGSNQSQSAGPQPNNGGNKP